MVINGSKMIAKLILDAVFEKLPGKLFLPSSTMSEKVERRCGVSKLRALESTHIFPLSFL